MKILHLISGGDTGGAKTHIFSLLTELMRDTDITLACFSEGAFSAEAAALNIPVITYSACRFFPAIHMLKKLIKAEKFDMLHCHGSKSNLAGALLRPLIHIPVVTTVHSDSRLDYLGRRAARLVYGHINSLSVRRLDYRIAVSDAMRDSLISRGMSPGKIFTIYNGVDFSSEIPPKNYREDFLSLHGVSIPTDSVIIGIAARLDPVKDIPTLLRAFALAEKTCPRLRLLIAGDGAELARLSAMAKKLNISEKTHFLGWVSDIDHFFASIDINVLTSLSETFPYSLTEGARQSRCTVSTRVGGIPALIRHLETGMLFTPEDCSALAAIFETLYADKPLRDRLGSALYEKALREFSSKATGDRQRAIYAEILRRRSLGRAEKDGVIICGSYGQGNIGDDAILKAIIIEMRGIDPFMPICVLARRVRETRERYGIDTVHSFNFIKFLPLMRRAGLFINGGGSLIQDVTSRRSLWYYLFTLKSAKSSGCRVQMYGCGIGPIIYPGDIVRVRNILNSCVDIITLRESDSKKELVRFGVNKPEIILSSDPALILPPADAAAIDAAMRQSGADPSGGYICFALRKWQSVLPSPESFAAAAEFAYKAHGLTPLFLPVSRISDADAAREVMALLPPEIPRRLIPDPLSPELTIGILSRAKTVVSMRLHGLIFAAGQGIPVVGVAYDPKVSAFLSYLGGGSYLTLDDLSPDKLIRLTDSAVRLGEDKSAMTDNVKRLCAIERRNVDAARRLLEK